MSHYTVAEYVEKLGSLLSPQNLPIASKTEYECIRELKYKIFWLITFIGLIFVFIAVYVYKSSLLTHGVGLTVILSVIYYLNKIKIVRKELLLSRRPCYHRYFNDKTLIDLAWWGSVLHALEEIVKRGDKSEKLKAWCLLCTTGALGMLVKNNLGICLEGSSDAKVMTDICLKLAADLGVEENWHLEKHPEPMSTKSHMTTKKEVTAGQDSDDGCDTVIDTVSIFSDTEPSNGAQYRRKKSA